MSLRNRLVLPVIAFVALAFLVACSSSSNKATPPPTGGFSNSNLNGTYVFSASGTDSAGNPFAAVGSFTANGQGGNGSGGVSGGTVDYNDAGTVTPNALINSNSSSYTVGVDGRGEAHLVTSSGTIVLDFVLQDSSHGLVIEFDGNSGSGTLDAQTAGVTPNGSYAFLFTGGNSLFTAFATVGNFTLSGSTITSGIEDFNSAGVPYSGIGSVGNPLSGTVVLGPSSTPGTTLTTGAFGALTFDVYAINANHLKFIETDTSGATLTGDAFSQSSTSMPAGTLAFTLGGNLSGGTPFAAGGFMVTDSSGGITSASTEDFNDGGSTISTAPIQFTGSYTASPSVGSGRFLLNNFSGFEGGTQYVAYPSSGGVLLLESDSTLAIQIGVASVPQTSTTFAASQGYGMNLTGVNLSGPAEVDDIGEFTASSTPCGSATGAVFSGLLDENFDPSGSPLSKQTLCGTYVAPDSNGRGQLGTVSGNNTLNGGFIRNFYTVDGTTFPFIEMDNGQVSTGVLVEQNASASASAAIANPHMFIAPRLLSPRVARKK